MLYFKSESDWQKWRSGLAGHNTNQKVRDWITLFNALSEQATGKSAVVTSWYRSDGTSHVGGQAVDFRRLSAANKSMPKYTKKNVEDLEKAALAIGIPVVVINRGKDSEHWHCGEIATLAHG